MNILWNSHEMYEKQIYVVQLPIYVQGDFKILPNKETLIQNEENKGLILFKFPNKHEIGYKTYIHITGKTTSRYL